MKSRPTLRALSATRFTVAQVCLGGVLLADLAAAAAGVVAASAPERAGGAALILAGLALFSATLRQASAASADAAHDILRRLDLQDGLGRCIDPATAADLEDDTPFLVRWLAQRQPGYPYFASSEQPSPRRMVKNIYESTWWTKRLARDMAWGAAVFAGLIWSIGIFMLVAAISGIWAPETGSAGVMSALILFLIAMGPQHARRQYAQLWDGAERVQREAELLLHAEPTEAESLALAGEYHLTRQGAPVVPTAWYLWRRSRLNELWDGVVAERAEAGHESRDERHLASAPSRGGVQ